MKIPTDFHNHVAGSSAQQMVEAARQRGLHVLGLSEHVFQMSEIQSTLAHMKLEGPLLTTAQYLQAVHAAAHELAFDVRLGLEVDFIPEKNERIRVALQGYAWDYLIGSVHQIGDDQYEHHRFSDQEEGELYWKRYFELLRAATNSRLYDVISHPARMRRRNPYEPQNIDDEYEHLAADATRCNVALEINGYDVLKYPETVRRLARACALHHTPISIGSDAHMPNEVAQAHQQTYHLLQEAGITTIRIWKQRQVVEYDL